jgi:transcriptional regulator
MIVMYLPPKFHMSDDDTWGIVSDVGAATLVLSATNGLESAFAPVIVSEDRQKLYSHLARANSWWRAVTPGAEVLALFVAASAYVSPLNYPSRIENPNVVPTWNYVMVQVRGKVRIHDDAEWKLNQVRALTHQFEHDHDPEWLVDDMDEEYRASQLKAIVGVEIDVVAIEGKAKLSQNRPDVDRLSVQSRFAQGTLAQRIVAERMKSVE